MSKRKVYNMGLGDAVQSRIRAGSPYVIKNISEDETEITMYGEIVQEHPRDWWTGEPVEGMFIALEDFMKDLDSLKGKSFITVHINSPGGDADAGRAIYNRLSEIGNVTTVCDSMAASAASIIFMAGETRKMYAGSQLMIHDASAFLFGRYQSRDLEEVRDMLDSYDLAIAEIYASKANKTRDQISHMMDRTTWLSAEEAVEQGFATEVMGERKAVMNTIGGGRYIVCNGMPLRRAEGLELPPEITEIADMAEAMKSIGIKSAAKRQAAAQTEKECKGGENMTLEELKKEHPELCDQIRAEAREEAAAGSGQAVKDAAMAERQRIRDIESIEASIADKELIKEAKYGDHPMDAKDLAFAAMQKQAALGNRILEDMKEDHDESGVKDVKASSGIGKDGIRTDTSGMSDEELDACIKNALGKGGVS